MEKVNKKTPIVFYVGIVLLGLVIISSYFTNGLYARYAVSEFSYDDARIASFDVNIVSGVNLYSELIELGEIQPGDERSISFTVNNNSEVAVALNIIFILPLSFFFMAILLLSTHFVSHFNQLAPPRFSAPKYLFFPHQKDQNYFHPK